MYCRVAFKHVVNGGALHQWSGPYPGPAIAGIGSNALRNILRWYIAERRAGRCTFLYIERRKCS
jgi:hypothetical protein